MDIGFDFFLFIAFFIPGVFILYALNLVFSPLNSIVNSGLGGKESNNWILVLSLCILLGMLSSILRSMIIDSTYNIDYSSYGVFKDKPNWKAVKRVEPNYSKLSKDELEGLRELKNEEKRPYQFYGNMVIALICFSICFLIQCITKNKKADWKQFFVILIICLLMSWVLYLGSRFSHYNYMIGVESLNNK